MKECIIISRTAAQSQDLREERMVIPCDESALANNVRTIFPHITPEDMKLFMEGVGVLVGTDNWQIDKYTDTWIERGHMGKVKKGRALAA